ncbi:ATP-binding cassette subfamily C protein LapB [Polymorphobacter multimanifer]|uniref:ATP-binding cassette subfamily C protein LapB n=1 Tax=Polymorphobacter multimanifer TaxID=1070431 RepID=A0A841LEP6_9SPHN|nr:type I secretion system permease/ATPase [Polymorphobacter multimanifer]MBB6228285.1 ATP-binding cassette subfamily C protein LapB [Polymorphobacter multimanifer]
MMRLSPWLAAPLAAHRATFIKVGIAAVFTNVFALATSLYSMTVYNRIVPNNATDSLIALSIGMAIVLVFDFILRMLRGYFVDVAGREVDAKLGASVFQSLVSMKLANRQASSGAFAGLLREFETLRDFFASATIMALVDVPFVLLFLFVVWAIAGPVVLVPLLMIPVVVAASLVVQPGLDRLAGSVLGAGFSKQGVMVETISGLETVKASAAGTMLRGRWQAAVQESADVALRSRLLSAFATNVAASAQQIVYVGVVLYGVFLIAEGSLTSGSLIAASILAGRCVAPLAQVAGLMTRLSGTRAAYQRLDAFMSAGGEMAEGANPVRRARLEGRITFRNVVFHYPGTTTRVLDDVSFEVQPGEKVAIVGRVGSGKSTVARLVLGLYQPSEGQVLVDGADVRQLHPDDLRRNIGSVLQDVTLFSGSIRDNIALEDPAIDDEELLRLARISGTHDFVGQLAGGYDLRLADRGEGLSGGQRQSIAIARSLGGRPPLIVYDEPTSAMDSQSENALVSRLEAELKDRTFLLVTHRQPMLKLVDRIIILANGKVAAQGPRDDVLRSLAVGQN